jgi:hypothetical protein
MSLANNLKKFEELFKSGTPYVGNLPKSKNERRIYLASRYSDPDPRTMEIRYKLVREATAVLFLKELIVFSPIVYAHEMSRAHNLPRGVDFWWPLNKSMIDWCTEFMIYPYFKYEWSTGVTRERVYAFQHNKPITFYQD